MGRRKLARHNLRKVSKRRRACEIPHPPEAKTIRDFGESNNVECRFLIGMGGTHRGDYFPAHVSSSNHFNANLYDPFDLPN